MLQLLQLLSLIFTKVVTINAEYQQLLSFVHYPRRARSALSVDTVLTLDVCLYVCMLPL